MQWYILFHILVILQLMFDKKQKCCVKRIYLVTNDGLYDRNVFFKVWILKVFICTQNIEIVSSYKSFYQENIEKVINDKTFRLQCNVQTRSFFWSKYRKIWIRKNSVFGHFSCWTLVLFNITRTKQEYFWGNNIKNK